MPLGRLKNLVLLAAASFGLLASKSVLAQTLPFELREGLIWVQVPVPGSPAPLNFLLDSGAEVSVVNLTTARRLGLKLGKRAVVQGVGSETTGYWPTHLPTTAAKVALPADYLAVDLNELSTACRCAVDGLLGADFFSGRVVNIDFAHKVIRLLPASPAPGTEEVLPLQIRQGAFLVPIQVNGSASQWVRLDTGCASNLHWVAGTAELKGRPKQYAVALTSLSVSQAAARVQLGNLVFEAVATGLHDKPIFPGEAGLLGTGLLSRFASVTLDTKANRLLLAPGRPGPERFADR